MRQKLWFRLLVTLMCFFITPEALANHHSSHKHKPALVYMLANETDGAFIDAAKKGALLAKSDFDAHYHEVRLRSRDNVLARIDELAQQGYNPIICVGYQSVMPVMQLAEKHPETRFTVIDGLVPPLFSNVQSIIFKDHEGSFLVGMLAAYTNKSGKIGFIGGMDIPLIRNFLHGYTQGAKRVKADIEILSDFVGEDNSAWSDNARAHTLATNQFRAGADVIFAAAGGAGIGVLLAAKEQKKYAIGVDANQNALQPGYVLTSMLKRVDVAVYKTLEMVEQNQWAHGIRYLGLKDGALDFSVDIHNRMLISEDALERVMTTKEHIVNGLIEVQMYSPR